jgi:flagellin-like protein
MKRVSGLKGISPLVAVIMLIAFTMVVAGILASWASQFATTQREQIQLCSEAFIFLQSGIYTSSTSTLSLTVWNNGKANLTGFTVIVKHTNDTTTNFIKDIYIEPGKVETLSMSPLSTDIKSVDVVSDECRGARDMLLKYNINGL